MRWNLLRGKLTDEGRLALYIIVATIPAVAFGVFLKKMGYTDLERNVAVVAWNTIFFGILMLIADQYGPQLKTIANVTLGLGRRYRLGPGARPHSGHKPALALR